MSAIRTWAEERPLLFVIGLAVLQPLIAIPFVAAARVTGLGIEPLRLVIPTVQSAFILWLIWYLGWRDKAGLTGTVRNVHLLWYPTLIAFVPTFLYGTVAVAWGPLVFYSAALVATGISEEGFARGIAIPALMTLRQVGRGSDRRDDL